VTLRWTDLIVSTAKMRTHHWAGVTLALKNLQLLNHPSLAALRD
jgi:uncharacterized protein (DUF362 family)